MNFKFHNKLTIKTSHNQFTYYNTISKNLLTQLSSGKEYNKYLAIGNGETSSNTNEKNQLSNHIKTLNLKHKAIQSDISKGELFAIYTFSISKAELNVDFLTEIGLSSNDDIPIIFNYFNLISDNTPNGLNIRDSDELNFEVTIYLSILEQENLILTSGENPFIEFLLGNGLNKVFAFAGSNYNEDNRILREYSSNQALYLCNINSSIENNELIINFSLSLNIGEIDEIVFITNNRVFARQFLKNINQITNAEITTASQNNHVIKINDDIKNVNYVINQTTSTNENNYYISKYANDFGDKVCLPFQNMFNHETPRFLSKNGEYIFFVDNDNVYAFKNHKHIISKINTKEICENYILNIICVDDFLFIISQISPFISTYKIVNGYVKKIANNFNDFENLNLIETASQIDITACRNNNFLVGILTENHNALTVYLVLNENEQFMIKSYIENAKEFNYVIALYKTNFNDGQIIYLKAGDSSASSRVVTHDADEKETDIYSYLAYALSSNASRVYSKGRAVISEKKDTNNITIYYYPQIYEYSLDYFNDNNCSYLSHNLNYLVKKNFNNEYKIFNLVGYSIPEEFITKISDLLDTQKIQDIEFLSDTILFFTKDESEKIIAYNLKLNKTQIENLSEANTNYLINYNKYNKIGSNQQTVLFNFITRISL